MGSSDHSGHRQRMRERFINSGGFDSFDEHQILEMLLFYALPRKDTNELAHRILNEFGNLDNLINSPPNAIAERTGVSINTAVLISMVGKIHSRQRLANRIGIKLDTVEKVKNYCVDLLKNKTVEVFYIICMNSKMNVISNIEVAKGSETQVSIDSKDLMRRICGMGTVTAVCAHNHPGGEDDFSIEDIKSTIVLKSCLKKCSIKLTDHILVYDNKAVSMVETKKFNL